MKKLFPILLSLSAVFLMSFIVKPANKLKVDTTASVLKWTGYHLAKSYEHTGHVQIKSGEVLTDGMKITSASLVVDMNTITDTDLTDDKKRAKLEGHLKSDDFFGVEAHPEAKIVIKSSEKKADNVYTTVADLTIKGITKEITFDTKIESISETELTAMADLRIQRTDFEVMYGWSVENAMLDGEFRLEVKIVAKK